MRRINQMKSIFVCAVAAEARLVTAMVEVGAKGPARTLLMGDTQAAGMLTVKHQKKTWFRKVTSNKTSEGHFHYKNL